MRARRNDLSYDTHRPALSLDAAGPREPGLRVECADGGRLVLRQGVTTLLLGRIEPGHWGVAVHRTGRYRSPVPPISSACMRRRPDWLHQFADHLERAAHGPLHAGRWLLRSGDLPPDARPAELVTDWPAAHVGWDCPGWNGVVPLRPPGDPADARVRAHRKHVRDGTLAPVLLWRVSALDGYVLLDGHDRLLAARAEGVRPPYVVLTRGLDPARRTRRADEAAARVPRLERHGDRARRAALHALGEAAARAELESAPTVAWPLPGGAPAWDALAAADAPDWSA
ncbi:hypothetical protein ACFV4F_06390 [Kitasatospora sp. NPDC059722]|uniref:hypothetical protein n=1 Tax=unclassified Kitasatospora TaxID=2633591 RepID=UPI00364D5C18